METETEKWGCANCTCTTPVRVLSRKLKKVTFIDAEFANEVLEIQDEMLRLQHRIEAIEPDFCPEQWLAERGLL